MDPLVLVEWLHRLMALVVSILLFATFGWIMARTELRRSLGGLAFLTIGLLVAQILLGALTVWKLLDPSVVSGHLGIAMLLFGSTLLLVLIARHRARDDGADAPSRPPALLPALVFASVLIFGQALLGGIVSSNYAGQVCPDWPTCQGLWFPPLGTLEGLHMLHRWGAYLLTAVMMGVAIVTRTAPDPGIRIGGRLVLALVIVQVLLGIGNVMMRIPVWLTAVHLGTAILLFGTMLTVAFRTAMLPARARQMAAVVAR